MAVVIKDPVTSGFWVKNTKDVTYRNLKVDGLFGLRNCQNILIENGEVFGNKTGDCCVVGTYEGSPPSKNITIRGIHFHDFAVDSPADHSQALYLSCVDGVVVEGCTFERIWGNSADLFITGWEVPGNAKNVIVRNCHFLPPLNPSRDDAIQWNDTNGGFVNHLYVDNLFDGCQPFPGTLKKKVTNFVFGVNYGQTPSDNTINYAKGLGVQFKELPFRPKSAWPGLGVTPPPPPPPPPPVDPCAAQKKNLADAEAVLAACQKALADCQVQ